MILYWFPHWSRERLGLRINLKTLQGICTTDFLDLYQGGIYSIDHQCNVKTLNQEATDVKVFVGDRKVTEFVTNIHAPF